MEAIFYDRRNKREVSSRELQFINLVYGVMTVDTDDPDFIITIKDDNLPEIGGRNVVLGELGYKSERCHKYCNWDLYCMYSDLVFLRFE